MKDGTIKVQLHSSPEKNKANKELIRFLADKLSVAKRDINIDSGMSSRIKIVSVNGVTEEDFRKIL